MNDKNELSLHGLHQIKNDEQQAKSVMPCFKQLTISTIQGSVQAQ